MVVLVGSGTVTIAAALVRRSEGMRRPAAPATECWQEQKQCWKIPVYIGDDEVSAISFHGKGSIL